MSDQLFHREEMTATSYTGPARSDEGSRQRVQLYNHHGGDNRLIDLSAEQWEALGIWFVKERLVGGDHAHLLEAGGDQEHTRPDEEAPSTSRRQRTGTGD